MQNNGSGWICFCPANSGFLGRQHYPTNPCYILWGWHIKGCAVHHRCTLRATLRPGGLHFLIFLPLGSLHWRDVNVSHQSGGGLDEYQLASGSSQLARSKLLATFEHKSAPDVLGVYLIWQIAPRDGPLLSANWCNAMKKENEYASLSDKHPFGWWVSQVGVEGAASVTLSLPKTTSIPVCLRLDGIFDFIGFYERLLMSGGEEAPQQDAKWQATVGCDPPHEGWSQQ